ncbi:MAG: hypothetical protein WAU82_15310 [Candidatus Binatus sp.]
MTYESGSFVGPSAKAGDSTEEFEHRVLESRIGCRHQMVAAFEHHQP